MPNIANYPNIRPSLLLDFANSGRVDPRVECVRSTTATRINSNGLIETVAANVPRISYDPVTGACLGLLAEEARTNLLINSVFAGAAAGTPGTAPTSWSLNASGGTTAISSSVYSGGSKLQLSAAANRHFIVQNSSVTAGQGLVLTVDIDVVLAGLPLNNIYVTYGTAAATLRYFLDGVEVSGGVQPAAGKHKLQVLITTTAAGNLESRLGVGVSSNGTGNVIFDVPQLEVGGYSTSYIPTTTAAVARGADVMQMTGANFSAWYRRDEGTMFTEVSSPLTNGFGAWTVSDGSTTDFIRCRPAGNIVSKGGVAQMLQAVPAVADVFYKTALAYKANDSNSATNGIAGVTDTDVALPTANYMGIANVSGAANVATARILRIAYYPVRLTNAQLQALTAP